jgi:hypothetical protein
VVLRHGLRYRQHRLNNINKNTDNKKTGIKT